MHAVNHEERSAVQAGIEGRVRLLNRRLARLAAAGEPFAEELLGELRAVTHLKSRPRIGGALSFRDGDAAPPPLHELQAAQRRLARLEQRVATFSTPRPRAVQTPAPLAPPVQARAPTPAPAFVVPPPASEASEAERRGELRAALQTSVSLDSGSNFFIGFTRNISRGGLFIACEDPLRRGTEVDLLFTLPGGRRIEALAEVTWVRERAACGPEIFPGMGVRFVQLAEADRRAIRTFMRLREPLFYPE